MARYRIEVDVLDNGSPGETLVMTELTEIMTAVSSAAKLNIPAAKKKTLKVQLKGYHPHNGSTCIGCVRNADDRKLEDVSEEFEVKTELTTT